MVASKHQFPVTVDSKTYPLGEKSEHGNGAAAMALVALSHTTIEHRLYLAMLAALNLNANEAEPLTARRLMALAEVRSLSTIRRGLEGLVAKLSVERERRTNGNGGRDGGASYRVFQPEQIIAKRQAIGLRTSSTAIDSQGSNHSFERAIGRVLENRNLSRREAQVALCCVEGLTNAEIGQRLDVSEQTVKFHLRHVFIKFGVKRRAELISRLLR